MQGGHGAQTRLGAGAAEAARARHGVGEPVRLHQREIDTAGIDGLDRHRTVGQGGDVAGGRVVRGFDETADGAGKREVETEGNAAADDHARVGGRRAGLVLRDGRRRNAEHQRGGQRQSAKEPAAGRAPVGVRAVPAPCDGHCSPRPVFARLGCRPRRRDSTPCSRFPGRRQTVAGRRPAPARLTRRCRPGRDSALAPGAGSRRPSASGSCPGRNRSRARSDPCAAPRRAARTPRSWRR